MYPAAVGGDQGEVGYLRPGAGRRAGTGARPAWRVGDLMPAGPRPGEREEAGECRDEGDRHDQEREPEPDALLAGLAGLEMQPAAPPDGPGLPAQLAADLGGLPGQLGQVVRNDDDPPLGREVGQAAAIGCGTVVPTLRAHDVLLGLASTFSHPSG